MHIDIGEWQVRSHQADDAESLARYANNRNVSRNMRDAFPFPYALDDAREWLKRAMRASPESNFAIASPTEVIGGNGLTFRGDVHRRTAEVGYWLGEPFWGRGIATAALQAVTEYAFAHHDLVRIDAAVFEWNPASARVLEKAGYVFEGRLRESVTKEGQTIDQLLYARIRE
ncbi:MAG: GNAT family N-acetyltransferase [Chloroflexi bacterium]|nr:GNAT family N-acetyltransferase [Chloroflexota bacterium]